MSTIYHEVVVTPDNIPAYIALHDASKPDVLPHWHESVELVCSLDSQLMVRRDQEQFQIQEHDVVVFNSNQIHTAVPLPDHRHFGLSITFNLQFLTTYCGNHEHCYFVLDGNQEKRDELIQCMEEINSLYRNANPSPYLNLRINGFLFQIAYILLTYFQISPSSMLNIATGKYRNRYHKIMKYMQEHYAEPLTLPDIAAFSNLSKEHLSREFKTYVGEGFRDHLSHIRISKSLNDLLHTDIPLIDLAVKHGFSDLRSYNRAFQKIYGRSPVLYRRENKRMKLEI